MFISLKKPSDYHKFSYKQLSLLKKNKIALKVPVTCDPHFKQTISFSWKFSAGFIASWKRLAAFVRPLYIKYINNLPENIAIQFFRTAGNFPSTWKATRKSVPPTRTFVVFCVRVFDQIINFMLFINILSGELRWLVYSYGSISRVW